VVMDPRLRAARRSHPTNAGHDTRALQAWLGHKNIQHTVRYTELAPHRFKDFCADRSAIEASISELCCLEVSRCADMAWWLPPSVSLGWTGCTAAMWAACRGRRSSAHGAAPVPNLAVPGCTQTPCRSAYRESLVRRFKCTVACTASTRSPPAAMA
jgi:hypothetical protein